MLREAKGVTVELKKKMLGPYVYRVSTSKTRYWDFDHAQEQSAQLPTPVLIGRTHERGALWWCQNRTHRARNNSPPKRLRTSELAGHQSECIVCGSRPIASAPRDVST